MGQTTFSGPVVSQNGFIENSFTTAQRDAIANPTAGLLIYNTTTNTYEVYNGTGWQDAFAPPAPAFSTPFTYNVNSDYYNMAGASQPGLYSVPGALPGSVNLRISQGPWNNQAGFANLLAMPVGTTGTVLPGGWFNMSFTTQTAFTNMGSYYEAEVSGDLTLYFSSSNQALDQIAVA